MPKRYPFLTFLLVSFVATASVIEPTVNQEWEIRLKTKEKVSIQFRADGRKIAWPARNQGYRLDNKVINTINTPCVKGENICFGAWVSHQQSKHWGSGPNGAYGCKDCCRQCGKVSPIVLTFSDPDPE